MAGNTEEERTEAQKRRIGLTTSQVAASALAASCAAIVASYLGVAGTISGAAIGSIVATTGSAFYGHAFHTGGKKIVKRLGPNTFLLPDPKPKAAIIARADAGIAPRPTAQPAPTWHSEGKRGPGYRSGYRKAAALAAALLVVFGAAITVGLLAGGPIRQSGTGINVIPPQSATRLPTTTPPAGSSTPPMATTSPSAATPDSSASGSVSPSGSPDATPSSDSKVASPPAASQNVPGP
jgi:hypothetical protein